MSDAHGVLSSVPEQTGSVPEQTGSVHQAEAVLALAGDLIYYCIEWIIIIDIRTYSLESLNYWWYISHIINLFD